MGTYQQPPLTPLQSYNGASNPNYDPQRPIEYGVEPLSTQVYAYAPPMDSFIENAINEMAHNPLAYLGTEYISTPRSSH